MTVSIEDNSGYIEIVEGTPNDSDGTLAITVKGLKETPAANNPLKLKAEIDGQEATVDVRVVIPKYHTATSNAPNYTNEYSYNATLDQFIVTTTYYQIITLTFYDQYGNRLTEIYNGNMVVEENFSNPVPDYAWENSGPINLPTGTLTNGEIADLVEVMSNPDPQPGALTPEQQEKWINGTLNIPDGRGGTTNSAIDAGGGGLSTVDIEYKVQGHTIEKKTARKVETNTGKVPPMGNNIPFKTIDTIP